MLCGAIACFSLVSAGHPLSTGSKHVDIVKRELKRGEAGAVAVPAAEVFSGLKRQICRGLRRCLQLRGILNGGTGDRRTQSRPGSGAGALRDRGFRRERFRRGGGAVRLMRQALAAIATAWLLFGGQAVAAEQGGDSLGAWIAELRSCTAKSLPRIAVLGFNRTEMAVSQEEAEELRLEVESRLQQAGRLALTSAGDVTRIKAMREGTTGLTPAEAEAQIRTAFDGDAAIFFVSPDRQVGRVRFRLQAITRAADCKATSESIELPLGGTPRLAEVSQVLANAVKRLVETVPSVQFVDVLPFSARDGHSICSAALTDALMVALAAEARDPSRVLNGKTLTAIRVMAPGTAEARRVSAHGTFELGRDNRAFINLEFKGDSGAIIAPTGRIAIAIDRLACDPTIRPFLDHVVASARTDRSRLDVFAPVFARGQRLEILITSSRPMSLYCWVLAPDVSGYVALPVGGRSASVKAGTLRYPRDFGLGDILLGDEPFENLFACFGTERDLPPALDRLWREHASEATADAKLIESAVLTALINDFRAAPGIVEATTRIVVR